MQITANDSNHYKFTGKERDTETGLDLMGRRYYSNPMGRFTSPDPLIIQKQKLLDPQQWNMYQYARDNPLRFTDPTGKYVCDGNKTQCGIVKAALDVAKNTAGKLPEGKERTALEKSIAAYGKKGEKNGVTVKFGDLKGVANAFTHTDAKTHATTVTLDINNMSKQFAETQSAAGEVVGVVGHEGVHVADGKAAGA